MCMSCWPMKHQKVGHHDFHIHMHFTSLTLLILILSIVYIIAMFVK